MLWNKDGLDLFLDISTYCNAGCPQCHRTSKDGLGKADWLNLINWDLETFKKAFPVEEIQNIKSFDFCGTWGDPVMNKDLFKMIEYIIDNCRGKVHINTNGSIRSTEWWWDLGVMAGSRLGVTFAIDGHTQEMHEKYRRFTSLEKVLENMQTLSMTRANILSQSVIFKHNQDYRKEIENIAYENGSKSHSHVVSDRFTNRYSKDGISYFIDENGNEDTLVEADRNILSNPIVAGRNVAILEEEIICRWALPRNKIVVNPDGQVVPCCYHANDYYNAKFDLSIGRDIHDHPIYKDEYNVNPEKYNVLHTPLSEILKSEWYQKTLPNSMKGDNPVSHCTKQCSSRVKKHHQLRETVEIKNV